MTDINIIKKIIGILCAISFGCTVGKSLLVSLLPLEFFLLFWYLVPNAVIVGGGFSIMTLVLAFRYVLYPIVFVNTNYCIDSALLNTAIILMIAEMLAIFITIYIFSRNQEIKRITQIETARPIPVIIPLILCIFLVYSIVSGGDIIGKKHFIFNVTDAEDMLADDYQINNVLEKVIQWAQFFITVVLIDYFYRKYELGCKKLYYYLVFFVLFLNCAYFSGNSRLSLLVPMITVVAMLYKIFGEQSQKAIVITISTVGIALVLMSIVKFFGADQLESGGENDMFSEYLLNAYFGGINNVIYGLKTYNSFGSDIEIFIIDALRGVMGLSKYFVNSQGTSEFFNQTVSAGLSRDQIMPTVTQGLVYFGPMFFWIPSVIMTYFVLYADKKWYETTEIIVAYCWVSVTIIVGWAIPGNLCHFFRNFTNVLCPLLLLIWINNRFEKE